jgi:ribose transport system substrate-binding protein
MRTRYADVALDFSRPAFVRFAINTSVSLLLAMSLPVPLLAQNKLNAVALTVGGRGYPFFAQIARGAETQAKKYNPAVKFMAESSKYDVKDQTNQMDNFISSGVNLILLNAADSEGIAPAVMRAKAAGITVIAVDAPAEAGSMLR